MNDRLMLRHRLKTLLGVSLVLLLVALLGTACSGCGARAGQVSASLLASSAPASAPERPVVLASSFASYDFARELAGEAMEVRMLLPPGVDVHSFDPQPRDIIAIEQCDVFIYTGGEGEAWIADILPSLNVSGVRVVRLLDIVSPLEEDESVLVGSDSALAESGSVLAESGSVPAGEDSVLAEDESSEAEPEFDEHVWTSPRNAQLIVQAFAKVFAEADPAHAALYSTQAQAYLAELATLDADFRHLVEQAERRTVVFGDRFPFRYLAEAYDLECYAAFPGCSGATEPDARTIAALVAITRAEEIPVVFSVELSNPAIAEAIAEETGARALVLQSCHTVSRQDFEAGVSYLSLMRSNLEALREALY